MGCGDCIWWLSPPVIQKAGDGPMVREPMKSTGFVPGCRCELQLIVFAPGLHEGPGLTALRHNIRC